MGVWVIKKKYIIILILLVLFIIFLVALFIGCRILLSNLFFKRPQIYEPPEVYKPSLIQVDPPEGTQTLSFPINNGLITAGFKNERYVEKHGFSHYGIDITSSGNGTANILASGNGIVLGTEFCDNSVGNIAVIQYDNVFIPETGETITIIARYYHMLNITISKDDTVTKGKVIGTIDRNHKWYNHIHMELDTDINYPFNTPQVAEESSKLLIRNPADGLSIIEPISALVVNNDQYISIHPNADCCTQKDNPKFQQSE